MGIFYVANMLNEEAELLGKVTFKDFEDKDCIVFFWAFILGSSMGPSTFWQESNWLIFSVK